MLIIRSAMNIKELQAEINAIYQESSLIEGSVEGVVVKKLLNLVERIAGENGVLKSENQALCDEINRLKGEKGKPNIKANKKKDGDISSEAERKDAEANANKETEKRDGDASKDIKKKKTRYREPKLSNIKIDREEICPLNKEGLPDDLVFKGYEESVVQNIIIKTDNVKYRREIYYSPRSEE